MRRITISKGKAWAALATPVAAVVAAAGLVAAPAVAAPASGGTLKIGLLVEETGQFSWYGTEAADGAKLYVKQHPKAGNRRIQFVTYDTQSNPQDAVLGFRKLVQQDGVNAVVGLGLTDEASVVAPLAASFHVPLYALSGSFTSPNQYTFTLPVQISAMQAKVFQTFKAKHFKRVALLTTNDATGQIADALFAKLAKRYGLKLVSTQHMDDDAVDVTPQLDNIEATHPNLIIAWEIGKPLGVVFSGAHQLGIKTPFLISYGNLAPGFLQSLAGTQPPVVYVQATKDVFWKSIKSSKGQAGRIKAFHNAYVKAYGQQTGLGSASGYDALMLLSTAVRNANSTSPSRVVSALEKLKGVNGVLGTYSMSKANHVGIGGSDTLLGRIKAGNVSLVR